MSKEDSYNISPTFEDQNINHSITTVSIKTEFRISNFNKMTRIKNCIKMPQFAKINLFELELCIRKENAKNPNKLFNKKNLQK